MVEPIGTCYEDAWRFLIKEEEGELVHGTVLSLGKRIGHAWVELPTSFIWEPESRRFIKKTDFQAMAKPQEKARYSATEAAIMLARVGKHGPWTKEEKEQFLKRGNPTQAVPEVKDWGPMGRAYQEEFDKRFFQKAIKDLEGKSTNEIASYYAKMVMEERTGDYLREVQKRYNLPTDSLKMHQKIIELAKPSVKSVPKVKESWQMTREEYHQFLRRKFYDEARVGKPAKYEDFDLTIHQLYAMKQSHKLRVSEALSEGKPVPAEVLREYPDLKPPAVGELKGGNPKAVPEGSIQTEIASLESEIKKKGRIISLIQSEARKEGLTDAQYLARLQDIAKDLAIPKTRVSTLGFEELEIPVANAVEALVVGGERTISSGFHGALNKRWTIVLDGKVSEKLEKAAREAGLEVKSREAPKGTGHYFTDVSLPDVGRADVETAKKAFDKFAENYTGRSIIPTPAAKGGNPMPRTEAERISFHERIFGKGSVPPVERLRRGQTVNNLLPMEPEEGPPLPRGLGIKWPWNK